MDRGLGAALIGRTRTDPAACWQGSTSAPHDGPPRRARARARRARHRAVGHLPARPPACRLAAARRAARDGPRTPYASLLPEPARRATRSRRLVVGPGHRGRPAAASARPSWRRPSRALPCTRAWSFPTTGWSRRSPPCAAPPGPDVTLMVDVSTPSARRRAALAVTESWRRTTSSSSRRRCGPTTSRATPSSAARSPVRIAAGEWLSTRARVRGVHRAATRCTCCSPTSAGSAG